MNDGGRSCEPQFYSLELSRTYPTNGQACIAAIKDRMGKKMATYYIWWLVVSDD